MEGVAIDWTAITAAIIGSTQFITYRYLGRILDKIEKEVKEKK